MELERTVDDNKEIISFPCKSWTEYIDGKPKRWGNPPLAFFELQGFSEVVPEPTIPDEPTLNELWEHEMMMSDSLMPRPIEDIWDAIGIANCVSEYVTANYHAKNILRCSKPV